MPRYARKIAESGVYHVMLRGINRQDIFEDEEDYQRMLDSLRHLPQQYDVKGERKGDTCCLYAYCLMPNHVHLLLRTLDWTIGEVVKSLADAYAMGEPGTGSVPPSPSPAFPFSPAFPSPRIIEIPSTFNLVKYEKYINDT